MAMIDWELHYDRRAAAGFLAHFLHGGVAESLAEYARFAPYPVDLQMRKNPRTGAEHATLYVGLTSVLQVTRINGDLLRLQGHKNLAGKHHAFDPAWSNPMTARELTPRWRAVEGYLEDVIPLASAKYANKEGAVQAAVSVFSAEERVMVDREVALTFKDTSTKTRICQSGGSAAFRRPSGGLPSEVPSGAMRSPTTGRMACARPSGHARVRALPRRGPTSARAPLPRSRWPKSSSRPHP
jgi:hypothetical protein